MLKVEHSAGRKECSSSELKFPPSKLEDFPEELILQILTCLGSPRDLCAVGQTSKYFNVLSKNASLWKLIFEMRFPQARPGKVSRFQENSSFHSLCKNDAIRRHQIYQGIYQIYQGIYKHDTLPLQVGDLAPKQVCFSQIIKDRLYIVSKEGEWRVLEPITGKEIARFQSDFKRVSCFCSHGDRLFAGTGGSFVEVRDEKNPTLSQIVTTDIPYVSCLHADKDRLYVGGSVHSPGQVVAEIWDLCTMQRLRQLKSPVSMNFTSSILSVEGMVITASKKLSSIHLFPAEETLPPMILKGHKEGVTSLCTDGKFLFSGSSDGLIKIWDLSDGQNLATLTEHQEGIQALCLDGQFLYSIAGGVIKVWDVQSRRCLHTLTSYQNRFDCFSAWDGRIYALQTDQNLQVWDFSVPKFNFYSLELLKQNLAILNEVAACESHSQREKALSSLDHLHEHFKKRLLKADDVAVSSSNFTKEDVSRVQAEVYAGLLMHALYRGEKEEVEDNLNHLEELSPQHIKTLSTLLCRECGWNSYEAVRGVPLYECAFREMHGHPYEKIQATLKFIDRL